MPLPTLVRSALLSFVVALPAVAAERPNILWLTSEDHGIEMGCYGDPLARTPNVDALAAKGMIFRRAWSVHPVCAPARTVIISGLYAQSSGGLHMRSMVAMGAGQRMYPQFLREAGYYATNNSKEDYNLRKPEGVWDDSSGQAHWRNRPAGKPFFAIFNSTKSHESQIRTRPHQAVTDPARVRVPAYHPDTPEVRQDWAQYYDKVSEADADAGARLRSWRRRDSRTTRSSSTMATTGVGCPAASAGPRTPACTYRWSSISRPNGGNSRRRNTSPADARTGSSALSISRRPC